ncbi:MAG: hypothetical protein OEZ68_04980 [Gammaproteobacteria bacterium]|nr:hypothetical protein [Gammaproteobacteria bacterium]MDH5800142.1 hypothetical protein [Gammaproteobacteria bacterium]
MQSLYIIPSMPALSIAIWVALSMVFLFFAREPVHKMFQALSDGTAGGFRRFAEWTKRAAEKMREKDRKVLLESGVANIQNKILQEFAKIESTNTKTLADYPKLQLKLDEEITKIEKDYKDCGQSSPQAPGWGDVIETISRAQSSAGDRIIEKMLGEIHKSAVASEKKALAEYRDIAGKRHKILSTMAPVWKRMEKIGKDISTKIEQVIETNSRIDKYMNEYSKLNKGDPDSVDMLSSRVTKLFIVSLIVIGAGIAGAFINFNLIALPMSELVPQGTRVAGMAVSEISALVVVVLELVLGIFLMEAIGVTNTFPQIGAMTSGKKKIIFWGTLVGLFFLSSVEASLAVLREHLAESNMLLEQALAGVKAKPSMGAESGGLSITVVGQATLGFVLPWILAMIAIPLEMFIEASQHAFARMYTMLVVMLGHLANALAHLFEGLFKVSVHVFDVYTIVPAKVAEMVKGKNGSAVSRTA